MFRSAVVTVTAIAAAASASTIRPTAQIPLGPDWLLNDPASMAAVVLTQLDTNTIELSNGLLSRIFSIAPFFATWDLANAQGSVLRGLSREGSITLDGTEYDIGGAIAMKDDGTTVCPAPVGIGPPDNCATAYFNRSVPYSTNATAFQYAGHWTSTPEAPFEWKPERHAPHVAWPPAGLVLNVNFTAPAIAANISVMHKDVVVTMHYEMYQGIPAMSKSMSVSLGSSIDSARTSPWTPPSSNRRTLVRKEQVGIPADQQGPVCLQTCNYTLPPSDWESRWVFDASATASQAIQLHGSQNLCLSVVAGTAYHSFNDAVDVRPCNASDSLQLWSFDAASGILATNATAEDLAQRANRTCGTDYPHVPCALDVNNHQGNAGTTVQVGSKINPSVFDLLSSTSSPSSSSSSLLRTGFGAASIGLWKAVPATSSLGTDGTTTTYHLQSTTFPNPVTKAANCMWHTPLPKPPAPPAPLPKPACDPSSNCTILSGAKIEVLRTNAPFAPVPATATTFTAEEGLLHIHPSQVHGSMISWTMDPTFDPDYSGNDGAIQPMVTIGYASAASHGGPGARLFTGSVAKVNPGAKNSFTSYKAHMVFADERRGPHDRERRGLGARKLTRMLAPQTSEAPLFLHLTDTTPAGVKTAVDQMVAVGGFDMLIFSFGSGFHLESDNLAYLEEVRSSVAYANQHGIEVGGYDLIQLDRGDTGYDQIDPNTGKSEGDACFASGWNRWLLNQTTFFLNYTGLTMVETDGPYGGGACAATDHDHYGADDSIQKQWENQVAYYQELRRRGIFVHAPDDYLFAGGSNKNCGWYEEMQFSLPRWQWISISHQQVFDGTWEQTPTQTWMFAPLQDYHSGGAPAALEPFSENEVAWNWTLGTYLGAGVGACYRGDRLYDTPAVQSLVSQWTKFWVKYRSILTQDIVHVKRPDMQSIDCLMHVTANQSAPFAALAMVYNPSLDAQNTTLKLDMYYTGATDSVLIAHEEGPPTKVSLARDYSTNVQVLLPPRGITYYVVTRG